MGTLVVSAGGGTALGALNESAKGPGNDGSQA